MARTSRTISDLADILKTFKVPDSKAGEVVDLFQFALIQQFGDTHLPYLYEVLGRDKFLEVLDIFQDTEMIPCPECGCSVQWPARDELAQILRDLVIYFRLRRAPTGTKASTMRDTADEFGMTTGQVRYAYRSTEKVALELTQTLKQQNEET